MGTSDITTFVKKLESFCECTICFCTYDENEHVPRILPCNHTFCTDCLLKHCSRQNIICPMCNQAHAILNKGILIFPKDNTRRELRDLVIKFASENLCNECQKYDSNCHFCINCNIRICYLCYEERKKKVCQKHKFDCKSNPLNDLNDLTEMKTNFTDTCLLDDHEKNKLKFFCKNETCRKPVCANCIALFHTSHTFTNVNDECETLRKTMHGKCQNVIGKARKAKTVLMKIKKLRSTMTTKEKRGREKLSATIRKGIQSLKEFEEKEMKKISESLISRLKLLEKHPWCLEEFINEEIHASNLKRESDRKENYKSDTLGMGTYLYTDSLDTYPPCLDLYFKKIRMKQEIRRDLKFLNDCEKKGKNVSDKLIYNLSSLGKSSLFMQMLTDKETFAANIRREITYLYDYEKNEKTKISDKLACNISRLKKSRDFLQTFIDNALECCAISELSMTAGNNISFLDTENSLAKKLASFIEMDIDQAIEDLTPSHEFEMEKEIKYVQSKIHQIVEAHSGCTQAFGEENSSKQEDTVKDFCLIVILLCVYFFALYMRGK